MKKRIIRITIWLFALFVLVFLLFNSSPAITSEDEKYLVAFLKDWKIELNKEKIHQSQESELAFIAEVQDSVLHQIQHYTIPFDSAGSVQCYYDNRKGLCFDRALLLEKFCTYAGFKIRHAYIYFNGRGEYPSRSDFFDKGLLSHAMFEVKTKNGWMAVGTNSNWLGLDVKGETITLTEIRNRLTSLTLNLKKQPTVGQPFYTELRKSDAFRFVYGVYSRHGQFLKSKPLEPMLNSIGIKSRVPDYNIRMLLANF